MYHRCAGTVNIGVRFGVDNRACGGETGEEGKRGHSEAVANIVRK